MSELRDLYQEMILDHYKRPRNFGVIEDAGHKAEGSNPLCGDEVTVYATVEDGRIVDISIQGQGCAISTASASLMTEAVKGRTEEEVEAIYHRFHDLVTGKEDTSPAGAPDLGKLEVLGGVQEFPVRVKCATLAWHTLRAALGEESEIVTTE